MTIEGKIEDGRAVDLDLIRSDGAYAGADYEAVLALSAAHHLLAARQYFDGLGLAAADPPFPVLKVVLFPSSVDLLGSAVVEDNAFYSPYLGGLAILRQNVFESLPFAANLGVLTHELSHAVFAYVTRDNPILALQFTSFNEGLADVHGAAVSGDAQFIGRSAPSNARARDLSISHVYDPATASLSSLNPYWYGAILASTFWGYRARLVTERGLPEAEARAHMSRVAYDGLVRTPVRDFTKTGLSAEAVENDLWNSFVARADELGEAGIFCASFTEHFAANAALSKVCP